MLNLDRKKTIIVTGSDEKYFPLLAELLQSIKNTKNYNSVAIGIFDLGLREDQKKTLQSYSLKTTHWDIYPPFLYNVVTKPKLRISKTTTTDTPLKVLLARFFMNKHFPGYRHYFWIDCDAFVQNEQSLDCFLKTSKTQGCAAAMHINYHTKKQFALGIDLPIFHDCEFLKNKIYMPCGAFCIDNQSGIFEDIQKLHNETIPKYGWGIKQGEIIFNYVFHKRKLQKVLKTHHHFHGYKFAVVDEKNVLIDPYTNKKIGIYHKDNVGFSEKTAKKFPLKTIKGGRKLVSIRYSKACIA